MHKANISLATAAVLIVLGFGYLAVSSGATTQRLQMKTIKLQSTEQKLNSINIQYQKLDTQLKTESSVNKEKIQDLKSQQEQLQKEKQDLEAKLQAKAAEKQRIADAAAAAQAAAEAQAVPTAYAASAPSYGGSHQDWMAAAGISASDYGAVDYIISHESGWNPNASNASSGAGGLPQALPYSKTGCIWGDPVCQLRWATGYANSRYGGWGGAYAFWANHHWW